MTLEIIKYQKLYQFVKVFVFEVTEGWQILTFASDEECADYLNWLYLYLSFLSAV